MFKLLKLISFIVTFSISSLTHADNHGPSDVDPNQIADILERSKARGKIIACADPFGYPYALQNGRPPGFDVEIICGVKNLKNKTLDGHAWLSYNQKPMLGSNENIDQYIESFTV